MSDKNNEPMDLTMDEDKSIPKSSCEEEDGGSTEEGGTSGDDFEQSENESSDDSMDGTLDKCPICLRVFRQQEVATPDSCEHCFCLNCIREWAANVSTCPIDRKAFHSVLVMDKINGQVLRVEEVAQRAISQDYDDFTDPTYCEICGCCDREERLLLCDECDMGYHLECLDPPLDTVPVEDWYCSNCAANRDLIRDSLPGPSSTVWTTRARSRVPRTELSRRIMNRRRRDNSTSPATDRCTATNDGTATQRRNPSLIESVFRRPRVRRRKRKTTRSKSGIRKVKRSTKKRRTRKQRVAIERRPATSRGRLVQQLGIQPPRPGQIYVGLPSYRPTFSSTSEKSTSATAIRTQRHQAGIAPLRIFATVDDLADCFEGSDDEGGIGVVRIQSIRIGDSRKRVLASANAQPATSINVLGPILSRQHILLKDKNIQIHSGDGRLVPSISVNPEKLIWSQTEKDDSSGYDSFGTKGSPPRIRNYGTGNTANGTNAPTSTNRQANSNSSNTSTSTLQVSTSSYSSGAGSGSSSNFFPRRSSSGGYNSEGSNTFEDFSGVDEYTNNKPGSSKKQNVKEKTNEEDDEFNIYSDIEDDPKPAPQRRVSLEVEGGPEVLDGGGTESDTDDMVIDEAQAAAGVGPRERDSRSSVESIALPTADYPHQFDVGDDAESPVLPDGEPDSPLSIPLPDSTPPPSVRDLLNPEDEDTRESLFDDNNYEEPKKDEYDPSKPLTDTEDEDDEDAIPLPPTVQPPPPASPNVSMKLKSNPAESSSSSSTILIPLPNDSEGRRPTIQFSIPSRHRIFSMSSLMKRNKGVMKKETKGESSLSFQSEMSKAFVGRKGEETTNAGSGGTEEKISLVAEIFGSDEEEDNETLETTPRLENENLQSSDGPVLENVPERDDFKVNENDTRTEVEISSDFLEGSKWKKLAEDLDPQLVPEPSHKISDSIAEVEDDEVIVIGETPPEVQIIETPPPETEDGPPLRRFPDAVLEKSTNDKSPLDSFSESENQFDRHHEKAISKTKKDEVKKKKSKSPKREKSRAKRRRSISQSNCNCEEGEIPDSPDKRRKKNKKSKKSKKRYRDSRSRSLSSSEVPASFSEKKIPSDTHGQISSEDEKVEKGVSWKKPSKSSKERNYRDGKPKTEEKYFREREKKQEEEIAASRNRDKTPPVLFSRVREDVDKERGRKDARERSSRRRSRSRERRTHSRHSNKSSGSFRHRSHSGSRTRRSRSLKSRRRLREYSTSPIRRRDSPLNRKSSRQSRTPPPKRNHSRRRSQSSKSRQHILRSQSTFSRSRSSSPRSRRKRREKLTSAQGKRFSPKKSKKESKDKKSEDSFRAETEIPSPVVDSSLISIVPLSGEKEKKKRKRRREKSISPAKAIFADGDSIVVSLNFQKGKETSIPKEDHSVTHENPSSGEKKKSSRAGSHPVESGDKPHKSIKKTILIDLESSPIQEQNIGVSPTLIVLSDDEDGEGRNVRGNDSDQDRLPSTTTSGEGGKSPFYRDGHGVPADSTQIQIDGKRIEFTSENDTTPARGEALVSSTRDSVDRNGVQDEYVSSPSPKDSNSNSPVEPRTTPPLPPGTPPPLPPYEKQPPTHPHPHTLPATLPPLPTSSLASRPLGGGLYTSQTSKSNLLPVAISNQSIPQLRLPTPNIFNPSVLATVASALYGPLMGTQQRFGIPQQQQNSQTPTSRLSWNPNNNVISKKVLSSGGGTVLLPKDQNYGTQRRKTDGDSPFSPNSSDGDDLFEPPKDSNQTKTQGVPPVQRNEKHVGDSDGGKKSRGSAHVFDSLFGGPIKKPMQTTGQAKPDKLAKLKSGHKSRSRRSGHKKAALKLNDGELRVAEDVPASAVDLRVKEKFLKKLNRQERVVEEVKLSLKPHYSKKHITKEEYKDILRRAVPKICHNKTGEINPLKIKELVEAYVKKIRKTKKK